MKYYEFFFFFAWGTTCMLCILNHNCIVLQASHIDKNLYKFLSTCVNYFSFPCAYPPMSWNFWTSFSLLNILYSVFVLNGYKREFGQGSKTWDLTFSSQSRTPLITVDFADQTVCGIFSSIKLIVAVRKNLVDIVSHRSCCCWLEKWSFLLKYII